MLPLTEEQIESLGLELFDVYQLFKHDPFNPIATRDAWLEVARTAASFVQSVQRKESL